MERPSHMIFNTHQSLSHRLPFLGLAACLQSAIFWLFTQGLGNSVVHYFTPDIELRPIPEKTDAGPKPPPIDVHIQKRIDLPPVTPPIFDTWREPGGNGITTVPPNTVPQTGGAVRAPVGIMATHSLPPYPVIARRVGWEGQVTLRLTVLADGRVAAAEVVTSSGRVDLDETAQAWIVTHWRYRPALDNGQPAVGHALATMVFSLKDAPLK